MNSSLLMPLRTEKMMVLGPTKPCISASASFKPLNLVAMMTKSTGSASAALCKVKLCTVPFTKYLSFWWRAKRAASITKRRAPWGNTLLSCSPYSRPNAPMPTMATVFISIMVTLLCLSHFSRFFVVVCHIFPSFLMPLCHIFPDS